MQIKWVQKFIAMVLCLLTLPVLGWPEAPSVFKIGAGDKLSVSISVQGSLQDLSRISLFLPIQIVGESVFSTFQLTVAPDGTVSIPSVDMPVPVAGLTLREAEISISTKLGLPSKKKVVALNLMEVDSRPFYIWGAVATPGRYVLSRPTSLIEGLSMAGGPLGVANLKKVLLVRTGEGGQVLNLSYRSLKENGLPNLQLQERDAVFVPKKWTADMSVWFLVLTVIGTAASVAIATQD